MEKTKRDLAVGTEFYEEEKRYNGWKNWETWITYAHITNDESLYNSIMDKVKEYLTSYDPMSNLELADYIKEVIHLDKPDIFMPLYENLLQGAIDDINFIEISKHLMDTSIDFECNLHVQ
tara:strand:- start:72 stop:431 length:360 start_codon:yes stop_codon:yes gene_type:complete